jgi:carbamate kinase
MIGYFIEQELGNLLPIEKPFATLLTMIEVDPTIPAFQIRPSRSARLRQAEADKLAAEIGLDR